MEISSVVREETSFLQGGDVRSQYGQNIGVSNKRIVYRSDSAREFMEKYTEYNEDDYIAFVSAKLAEKWAENMQAMRKFSGDDLNKDTVDWALKAAKITVAPCHVEGENIKVAKEILVANWAHGGEFAKIAGFDEGDIRRIRAKADVHAMLHEDYRKNLDNEKIDFASPLMEKYWNFKANGCDAADKDCFALAEDWIKTAQLFIRASGDNELTEDILYESALQVRQHNPLAKNSYDENVLKIRDDYYNRVVQAMICCWKQGENVGKIHSTDNVSIAKIRKFPVKDSSFKCYMKGKGYVFLQYALDRVRTKIHQ